MNSYKTDYKTFNGILEDFHKTIGIIKSALLYPAIG